MRILILNYEFPPLGGGAGNATQYLLREFAKRPDFSFDLVTSSADAFRIEQYASNIMIHFLDIGKKGNLHYQRNKDLLKYSWKAYWYCKKLIKARRQVSDVRGQLSNVTLVHAFFGIPCGYIAMKLGLPYIVSLRGSDVPFYNRRFYWLDKLIFRRLSRRIWRRAKAVIANSEGLKELALKTAPVQVISIIPNGVDVQQFCPANSGHRKSLGTYDVLNIISTGRLIERKGYAYLLLALEGLHNVELMLIGDGPLRGELERMAREKRVKVNFAGTVAHGAVIGYLQNADVFVLPSLNEGMSNAILEAMACGLPIIATDTGGSAELVQGNGFIVPRADSGALRKVIMGYMQHPDLAIKHGVSSRKRAEGMSWQTSAEEYQKIYELA